jgi:hypothetical protein
MATANAADTFGTFLETLSVTPCARIIITANWQRKSQGSGRPSPGKRNLLNRSDEDDE